MSAPPRTGTGRDATQCELRVGGMDCASCAATIERALRQLEGVDDVQVDVVGGRVRVAYEEARVARGDIAGSIRRAGYTVADAAPPATSRGAVATALRERGGRVVATVIAGVFLLGGILLEALGAPAPLVLGALAAATFAGARFVAPRGVRAVRHGALDMNFLMSAAALGAWIIGEPTEAAATLFLFSVAELLEGYSMDRARHAIRTLMDLSPAEARVRREGAERRVPVADVAVGEIVIVRPGEKVPVDGAVVAGRSAVNQAPITGESMPVDKEPGAEAFAGSLNGHGVLEVRATKPAADTTLAHIIHAVEEAQASRAPAQTFVNRFARVYTPAVVALAVAIAVLPPLAGAGGWETWIYRALAMLVIACPCALVISTPVSIVSGLAGAARAGVLIKGGAHLENLGRVSAVAFDKTGTLSAGRPAVTEVVVLRGASEDEVLCRAMAVERHSEHPLGAAVVASGAARGLEAPASHDFAAETGRGARAIVEGRTIRVGNPRLLREAGVPLAGAAAVLERLEAAGRTAIAVAEDDRVLGVIGIADTVRPEAARAIGALRELGVGHVVMLTGDNAITARAVAEAAGIDDVRAELLPDDKLAVVHELAARGERVAFVGDGVNDAPALAASSVGIAMGVAGTDVALETADVALMRDDLAMVPVAVEFSRRTLGIVRQNIVFALGVKAVFVVLAVAGEATLWMAVAADMGASLAVVLNGLRAMHLRRDARNALDPDRRNT